MESINKLAQRLRSNDGFELLLMAVFALALAHALFALWIGLFQPLIRNSFRETQTALSAYWMWRGGPLIAYETPTLGFPWSIPFEFPIYQWLVAAFRAAGVPINIGGKIISFSFYLACLLPIGHLFKTLQIPRTAFLIFGILFLTSPFYLYFSGAVLVEFTALFFGFWWLASMARFLQRQDITSAVTSVVVGTIASLAKSTTFPAFALLGGLLVLREGYVWMRGLRPIGGVLAGAALCIVPFVPTIVWLGFSDSIKMKNEAAKDLTSVSLVNWTFGTFKQRFEGANWRDIVGGRMLLQGFGDSLAVAFIALGAALVRPRYGYLVAAACLAFLTPILVFTNLHLIHAYYQYANLVFALAAIGLSVASLVNTRRLRVVCLLLLAGLVAGNLTYFYRQFAGGLLNAKKRADPMIALSLVAKNNTTQDEGLIVFGDDWSSVVPYYSQRKSFVVPPRSKMVGKVVADPKRYLGELTLGGVIVCPDRLGGYGDSKSLIEQFVAGRKVLAERGTCKLYEGS